MANDDNVIDDAVVKVKPDTTGFKKELQAQLKKELAGVEPSIKVKLVADKTGFAKSVREQLSLVKTPEYKVKLVADTRGFANSVRQAMKDQKATVDVKTRVDNSGLDRGLADVTRAAKRETGVLEQESKKRSQIFDRDARNRQASLKNAFKAPPLIDFGGQGVRPMNLLYGAVAALTPALFAMGTSAVQAASGVAALGAAGTGAALGISALALSFSSISEVLKLRGSANNAGLAAVAKSGRDQANNARDLANAQRDEKAAAAAVHTARREAIRDLQDLRQAVIDLDNEYKSNKLSVAEAEQNEAATNRNFFATALERARAHQNTLDARTKLSDTTLERKQKRQDLAHSVKVGVEGSDKVVQARERARDARDRRLQLSDKKASGALDSTGSAAAQLAQKFKELSPAGREMYKWFDENDKKLKDLRRTIQQGTLPGFTTFLKAISATPKGGKSTLQLAAEYAAELGGIIGKYAGRFGKFTQTALFRKDMATIQKNNATALDTLGKAAERFMRPMLRIFAAASPLLVKFADKLLDLATQFDTFIEKAEKNGSLKTWFDETAEQAKQWWRVLVNAGRFLRDLFTAAKPAGGSLVKDFADYMERLANWSSSAAGQKSIKDFFDTIATLPYDKIRAMLTGLGEIFLAKHVASWVTGGALNAVFAGLGILAASHPDVAIRLLEAFTFFVETAARIVSANPDLTAMILALVALSKVNKATGGALFAVTGLDKLKEVLTGKFKILDKFLGGGAATSVMNVRAAVVNVYGGSGLPGGAPGPGSPVPTPVPVPASKVPGGLAAGKSAAIGALHVAGGLFVATMAVDAILGESGSALDGLIALAKGPDAYNKWSKAHALFGPKTVESNADKAMSTENEKFRALQGDIFKYGYKPGVSQQNVGGVVNRKPVQDYIAARKASVAALVEDTRVRRNAAAAKSLEVVETQKTANALTGLLQQYGWTEGKARSYANQVSGLNDLLYAQQQQSYAAKTAVDKHGKSVANAGKKAEETTPKIQVLNDELNKTTGERIITFTTNGKDEVITDLEGLAARQQLIRQGKELTPANIKEQERIFAKGKAEGGIIDGYSPHDKADNIPAWLTANEYVQPVASVKYYGTDFMEAVRTRKYPRFAKGGSVQSWPFPVKAPDASKPVQDFVGIPGTGPNGPAYTGKIPKGVGAIAGVNAQLAAAAIDAHKMMRAHVTSGLRTGRAAITVTGNKSYHGFGRAIDLIPPSMALFNYLKAKYGKFAREIIYSPAGNEQIWRGKPHMYTGKVRATHYNHVHLALAQGGLVQPRKFDSGGVLPPGYTLAFNGTGRNETVRTDRQERQVQQGPMRLDRRDIALLASAVNTGANTTVSMDGRRVAELTNRYNYLPAGV